MSSIVPCAPSNSTDFPSSSARFTNSAVSQMYSRIFSPSFSVSSTSCEKSMSAPYAPLARRFFSATTCAAFFRKRLDLRHQRSRIHHHARADHGVAFRPQNPARDELQHKAVFPDDDGVPGVVAACNARDVIKRTRKVVHHLAFALIAPLRAHHHDGFHSSSFSSHAPLIRAPPRPIGAAPFPLRHCLRGNHWWESAENNNLESYAGPALNASKPRS